MQLLRRRQIEIVDDVCDVGHPIGLPRGIGTCCRRWGEVRAADPVLVAQVLVIRSTSLTKILMIYILHTRQRILLLILTRNIRRPSLIKAPSALKPFMLIA